MRNWLSIGAIITASAAVVTMILPTWRVEWMGPTPDTSTHTHEFWGSPLLFGYGLWFPVFALLLALAAVVAGFATISYRQASLTGAILAALAVLCALIGHLISGGLTAGGSLAVVALAGSAALFTATNISYRRASTRGVSDRPLTSHGV